MPDHLIDPGQPALPLPDDLRLERRGPVPPHVDLDMAGGVGQYRLDRLPSRILPVPAPGGACFS